MSKYKSSDMNDIKQQRIIRLANIVYNTLDNHPELENLINELEDFVRVLEDGQAKPLGIHTAVYMKGYAEGLINRFDIEIAKEN